MNVILSVNSDVGVHGKVGFRTGFIASEAYKKHILKKVICRAYADIGIPKSMFKTIGWWYRPAILLATGIRIFFFPKLPSLTIQNYLFNKLSAKSIEKCEILHCWDILPDPIKRAKEQGAIVIADIHIAPALYKDGRIVTSSESEVAKYGQLPDYFIAPSEYVRDCLQAYGIRSEKIFVVPFGVDTKNFTPSKDRNGTFRCIFSGSFSVRKGVKYLIEAWNNLALPDAELIICGLVHADAKEYYKLAKKNKTIVFKGNLRQDDLVKAYQSASVFILPSRGEGSAKSTYEALSCGLPLITTYNTGSIIEDGKEGFIVSPENSKEILEKIRFFYQNPSKARMMGLAGRKKVEKYTWERYAQHVINIYKSIANKHNRAR